MLKVDYLRPTPLGPLLRIVGRANEITPRKTLVSAWIEVDGEVTARAEIIAVPLPESMRLMIERAGGPPPESSRID
jgi:acyl-coenzyme A thioesterase PaaI-like protein